MPPSRLVTPRPRTRSVRPLGVPAATRTVIAASGAAVVCLTAEATADEREEILRAGAVALVEKGSPIDGLAGAIRAAAA